MNCELCWFYDNEYFRCVKQECTEEEYLTNLSEEGLKALNQAD